MYVDGLLVMIWLVVFVMVLSVVSIWWIDLIRLNVVVSR